MSDLVCSLNSSRLRELRELLYFSTVKTIVLFLIGESLALHLESITVAKACRTLTGQVESLVQAESQRSEAILPEVHG